MAESQNEITPKAIPANLSPEEFDRRRQALFADPDLFGGVNMKWPHFSDIPDGTPVVIYDNEDL
ncbi:hypothetical protein ACWGQ4_02955 [Streptomyces sp. NPDC055721]|uniref:hypothetical protein n=1 Tax=Streptomyces sp. NPDC127132 TaxID=3345374 RepID=UPI0036400F9D